MKRLVVLSLAAVFCGALALLSWSKHDPEKSQPRTEVPTAADQPEAHRSAEQHAPRETVQPMKGEAPPDAQVAKRAVELKSHEAKEQSPEARSADRTAGLRKSRALLAESVAWLKERRAALGESRIAEVAVLDRRIERMTRRLQTLEQGRDPDEGVVVPKH
jgi:hypothetical protein